MRPVSTDPVRARWAAGETAFAAWLSLESPAAAGPWPRPASTPPSSTSSTATLRSRTSPASSRRSKLPRGPVHPRLLEPPRRADARARPRRPRGDLPDGRVAGGSRGVRGRVPLPAGRDPELRSDPCRLRPRPRADGGRRGRDPALRDDRDGRGPREPRRDRVHTRAGRPVRRAGRPQPRDGTRHVRRLTDPVLLARWTPSSRLPPSHGLAPGIHAPVATARRRDGGRGFRFVSCAVDEDLLRGAAAPLSAPTRAARAAPGRLWP